MRSLITHQRDEESPATGIKLQEACNREHGRLTGRCRRWVSLRDLDRERVYLPGAAGGPAEEGRCTVPARGDAADGQDEPRAGARPDGEKRGASRPLEWGDVLD